MLAAAILLALSTQSVPPHPPTPPAVATAAENRDAAALAVGWQVLAGGQFPAAVRAADSILQRRPWDHAAVMLKITALSAISAGRGLDGYEQWIGTSRPEDAGVLEPVAMATLREIAASTSDPGLRRSALTALAASGDETATRQLAQLPESRSAADIAAARNGDRAAVSRLARLADPKIAPRNPALARELADGGAAAEPILIGMLQSSDAETRTAAAVSLGTLHAASAREPLQRLAADPNPLVRNAATVALAKLGDATALSALDQWLGTGIPELQLAAAQAFEGQPGPWVDAVRPLLSNQDGLTRIEAAKALRRVDPAAAQAALAGALADPNPVMRAEAASALASVEGGSAPANVTALRRLLHEQDPVVRLAAAKVLLVIAKI